MLAGERVSQFSNTLKIIYRTVFALNVFEEKPAPGLYSLSVSVNMNQADPRIPSNIATTVPIKSMCDVTINSFEIGTADADQTTQPRLQK